ncbi:uncharacterized protein LAJ45_10295 [Morchella importuna]|uniref:uncharacterized protein n=1 Tax=Morchella importuna TaxID=1174673 RepID=UPI001E8DFF65|nr:uncharacterized protein LAJ45_10295 [Morchella importuna]KAH8145655.1 hypothetical protein LAJ45_10295 [Morchella importuna]
MALACKTADLLALATHALNHLTSPNQHALLTASERRSALQQLVATAEGAAKLAEVAHAETLPVDTERIRAETERLRAEAAKVGKEVERAVVETERLKAEAMVVRSVKMRIDADTERMRVEAEGGGVGR